MTAFGPIRFGFRAIILSGVAACLLAAFFMYKSRAPLTPERQAQLLTQSRQALQLRDLKKAENLLRQLTGSENLVEDLAGVWAQLHALRGDFDAMNNSLAELRQASTTWADDRQACAEILIDQGRLSDALSISKQTIEGDPDSTAAATEVIRFCRIKGTNLACEDLLRKRINNQESILSDLRMLAVPGRHWAGRTDQEFINFRHGLGVRDLILDMAYARMALQKGRVDTAGKVLKKLLDKAPRELDAQALLGRVLIESGDRKQLAEWYAQLPSGSESHSGILSAAGAYFYQQAYYDQAASTLIRSLALAPTESTTWQFLTRTLHAKGLENETTLVRDRAERLAKLDELSTNIASNQDRIITEEIVRILEALGRYPEAREWCRVVYQLAPAQSWAKERQVELSKLLADDQNTPTDNVLEQTLALSSRFPRSYLPPVGAGLILPKSHEKPDEVIQTRFENQARNVGVDFKFHNGARQGLKLKYMFEFSGPGVGVIDFDADGWPDLYMTQGSEWPPSTVKGSEPSNSLFRNLDGLSFTEIAHSAQVLGVGYGQGIGVGDINNDGFDDLYICNIGTNIACLNLGDGTLQPLKIGNDSELADWSISAVICDMNKDSNPDIYVVNYLSGDDVFTRPCFTNGRPVQCFPQMFPECRDRLYLGDGEGGFVEHDIRSVPDGKGMTAVATVLRNQEMGLLIANDTTPNRLLMPTKRDAGKWQLEEIGIQAGIAFSPSGTAQSSMGADAGDVNGDGLVDFVVTNFFEEPNNLYMQQPDGTFIDEEKLRGLHEASHATEGWGIRLFDADADGDLDLFVANGHLEDFLNAPGRMLQHLFRNRGGFFELIPKKELGGYFEEQFFGRSVAQIDWNRDGLNDLCVTHVTSPVALLTNKTTNAGNRVSIRLRGRSCSRDAIGSTLVVETEQRRIVRWLSAGGYAATNERLVDFGLGKSDRVRKLHITWPDSTEDTYEDLEPNMMYECIQGRSINRIYSLISN